MRRVGDAETGEAVEVPGGAAADTPIGLVPTTDAIDLGGLDLDPATLQALLSVDPDAWQHELPLIEAHFDAVGSRLPAELRSQLDALRDRLGA